MRGMPPRIPKTPSPDWALILALGGPAKVAELMKLTEKGSVQRIQNWKYRGIPASVKLRFPELFLKKANGKRGG